VRKGDNSKQLKRLTIKLTNLEKEVEIICEPSFGYSFQITCEENLQAQMISTSQQILDEVLVANLHLSLYRPSEKICHSSNQFCEPFFFLGNFPSDPCGKGVK
jgi:hypothetical protein